MINKVILLGRVGSIESKENCTIVSIATTEQWTKDGKKEERTEWHRVTFFSKLGEIVEKYVVKGQQIFVEGKIQYSQVEGKKGEDTKYFTNIIGLEMKMLAKPNGKSEDNGKDDDGKEEKSSKNSTNNKGNAKKGKK